MAVGCIAFLVALGAFVTAVPKFCGTGNPWLGASLFLSAVLGIRAARRVWRLHRAAAGAVLVFTTMVSVNLIVSITSPSVRPREFWRPGFAAAAFVAGGFFAARELRQASLERPNPQLQLSTKAD